MIRCPSPRESGECLTLCDRCHCATPRRRAVWRGKGVAAYRLCPSCAYGPRGVTL